MKLRNPPQGFPFGWSLALMENLYADINFGFISNVLKGKSFGYCIVIVEVVDPKQMLVILLYTLDLTSWFLETCDGRYFVWKMCQLELLLKERFKCWRMMGLENYFSCSWGCSEQFRCELCFLHWPGTLESSNRLSEQISISNFVVGVFKLLWVRE